VGSTICAADKAKGGGAAGVAGFIAAGGMIDAGAGLGGGAAAIGGRAGGAATAASSSAMICLMDERISSIDGSLVAGLFIKASFDTRRARNPAKMRLIRHRSLYADMLIFATQSLGRMPSSPDFAGLWTR
jgi:hypothetical protein